MDSMKLERALVIRSQIAKHYVLNEAGHKNLQHLFTTWLPRVVYFDLTDDTASLLVIVRRGTISGRNVFKTSFVRADGSEIKCLDYDEDRMIGRVCKPYLQEKTAYLGKNNGFDERVVHFQAEAPSALAA